MSDDVSYSSRVQMARERNGLVTTQLHAAYSLVEARAHFTEDRAMLRTIELSRREQRRQRRAARRATVR